MHTRSTERGTPVFAPPSRLPGQAHLVLRCISSDMASRAVLRQINRRLAEMGIAKDRCQKIEIVLAEALNNIVEHAYSGRTNGPLELRGILAGGVIRFELIDEGTPLPGLQPPNGQPLADDVDPRNAPEGGFGWFLIRKLASRFTYTRSGRFNYLQFDLPA